MIDETVTVPVRLNSGGLPVDVIRRLIELSGDDRISDKYGIKVLTEELTQRQGAAYATALYVANVIEHLSTKSRRWFDTGGYREIISELSGIYLILLELSGSVELDR